MTDQSAGLASDILLLQLTGIQMQTRHHTVGKQGWSALPHTDLGLSRSHCRRSSSFMFFSISLSSSAASAFSLTSLLRLQVSTHSQISLQPFMHSRLSGMGRINTAERAGP